MGIFITSMGVISPLGAGIDAFRASLRTTATAIAPVSLFSEDRPLPVGEIRDPLPDTGLPRTHALALIAAEEALAKPHPDIDAIVFGGTTGGMPDTEIRLMAGETDPAGFRPHGTGTVAEALARRFGCAGPVITVSTACSSGSAAIQIALHLLRSGRARCVLAGGADALCHLTYHGFHTLQLIDPTGPRPFDKSRKGMSVGEGAAVVVMEAADSPPADALAEVIGGGLSCDAFHPTAPHPEGRGAAAAIRAALADAGLAPEAIDYINLHGTGTPDNDRSEARALNAVFGAPGPPASSIKGAMGHPLAAAGAIEAAASVLALSEGLIPASTGFRERDPEITLTLVETPEHRAVRTVLSNSFGFGGNNAALVFATPVSCGNRDAGASNLKPLRVRAASCLTGAGDLGRTLKALADGASCAGLLSLDAVSEGLSPRLVRRLKRLSRMALGLSAAAAGHAEKPTSVFWATGWGPLSETHNFLTQLFETGKRFAGPTDFVGSVHNAPAGHIAIHFGAEGPNLTLTGGDASFEQALLCACILAGDIAGAFLVVGGDEWHPGFSRLFDPSAALDDIPSDGGAALLIRSDGCSGDGCPGVFPRFLAMAGPSGPADMVRALGGAGRIRERFGAIFAGIPAAWRHKGDAAIEDFRTRSGFDGPVLDYRKRIGEFASASAVAAALAVACVKEGRILAPPDISNPVFLDGRGILVLGFGQHLSAVEVLP